VPGQTIQNAIDRAIEAYASLTELGEGIDDEWSYVNDLSDAWRGRFDEVVAGRGDEPIPDGIAAAIDLAIEQIGLIVDAHRAIDWLSTFPQVVLVAVGETP
jgi:hypothetical protein